MKLLLALGAVMLVIVIKYYLDIKQLIKKHERIERSK